MLNNVADILQNADSGFAIANDVVLEDLQKALTAGYGSDSTQFGTGRALIPESLDTTLVSVLHTQDEAKLFQALKKEPVSSTVHEYNKRTEVGDDDGAWVSEGGNSEEKNQTIARKVVNMKYLQTLRKVTLQMSTAKTVEDAMAIEQNAGTLWIIRNVERVLFDGDAAVIEEQPDGLNKQLETNVIDMRGALASSQTFEDNASKATRQIRDSFGKASLLLSSTMIMEDIQKLLRDRIRVPVNQGAGSGGSGNYVFDIYPTKFGKPKLEDDVFIKEGSTPVTSTLATKPDQVSIALVRQAVTGSRVSQFITADAGDYYYQVVAVTKFGDALASTAVQVTSVVAGDEVEITVTDGSVVGTGFKVYRSKKDAANGDDCRFMFQVAYTGAGQIIYDVNADLPGTSSAYIFTLDELYNAIEWNQFLPLMKFQLYPTNAAVYPFLMLLFGALNVKKEEQMARIKNIAPSGLGWF